MQTRKLTRDIAVSRLGMGCLCMGYLQQNLTPQQGADLVMHAADLGINLFDTAQYYRTYEHLARAIGAGYTGMVISSKSYAYDEAGARQALQEALSTLGRDYIDIFLLHETTGEATIKGHWEAMEYYLKAKREGKIRAVGISTHSIAAVQAATAMPEIEIIEALINKDGLGISDGDQGQMSAALAKAHAAGKGIIAMKPLGGGNLASSQSECFDYLMAQEHIDSILCGMIGQDELEANVAYFEGQSDRMDYASRAFASLSARSKRLLIEEGCVGCGSCIKRCPNSALELIGGKAVCNDDKCLKCAYCAGVCPEFALRIVTRQ